VGSGRVGAGFPRPRGSWILP